MIMAGDLSTVTRIIPPIALIKKKIGPLVVFGNVSRFFFLFSDINSKIFMKLIYPLDKNNANSTSNFKLYFLSTKQLYIYCILNLLFSTKHAHD